MLISHLINIITELVIDIENIVMSIHLREDIILKEIIMNIYISILFI